jgi:oligopeptide transport system permease protein
MVQFIVRRLASAIPTLFIIITLAFFMMRAVPGGPFDAQRRLPAQIEANLKAAYDLDKPLLVQYGRYLANLARGDFGPSFKYKDFSVTELIWAGFPVSATLGISALALALIIGVPIGSMAALGRNGPLDHAVMALAMTGIALPNFVVAPVLTLVLGVYLHWLPVAGWADGALDHLVLPVVALALPYVAYVARLTRAGMIEALGADYVRTAYAKGLSGARVVLRHALRAGVLPLISFLGPALAGLMTGSVVIEMIFDLPGLGRYFVQGALNRDYTLVMGVIIFYAVLIVMLNFLVDLLYGLLDPRVRLAR